ncbi:hypothetical protein AAH979_37340 [Plantactinospora sp. ZYX-F-223]|uniref:hypothetical protein n=1 Tax=Plantactinospora sp. ZYX-F-223 TaxID=3144103 RepID=UPI0031FD6E98
MLTARLYRLASAAGLTSAAILLVNTAKRAGVIPITDATQLIAPLAQVFALVLITALFIAYGRSSGPFGTIGFALNFVALAALVGVEFVINLVFAQLPDATIADLRAGPLGVALTVASVLFLVGTWTFGAALWRIPGPARPALALYAVGAVPVALRAAVPEVALQLGLLLLAITITWLAVGLWRNAEGVSTAPV